MPRPVDQRPQGLLSPLPGWLRRTVAFGVAVLVVLLLGSLLVSAMLQIGLVSFALLAAVLLAALLAPLSERLRRSGLPGALAALVSILVLLGIPTGIGALIFSSVADQVDELGPALLEAVDGIRGWLEDGPLAIDPTVIDDLTGSAAGAAEEAAPGAVAGTTTVARGLIGVVLTVFAVFFLVKDGRRMWEWLLRWFPRGETRDKVDGSGRVAWTTLTSYVRGTALVALVDAVGIGLGLVVLDVPLWLSLALLTFVGGFVPIIGAFVAGVVAVLVTLVTNGPTDALIILVVVVVVQQVESNLLQPLIMGQVIRLHPLVIACAVTAGTLVLGVAGAVIAVPVVAVVYRVVSFLSGHDEAEEAAAARETGPGTDAKLGPDVGPEVGPQGGPEVADERTADAAPSSGHHGEDPVPVAPARPAGA
ncbi:AI-2E family transporter [Aquipuribacter sp. MA13-6]|uniref:AI-2E family transporter n=1 Tax=unclassified Aquipuribacter TaxID=2635084 RepID=UPI003EEA737E